MITVDSNAILALLTAFAIVYAVWMIFYISRSEHSANHTSSEPTDSTSAKYEVTSHGEDIVGKSLFVLPQRHSLPQAANSADNEKPIEKPDIFVPSNVPGYPRVIPEDELDEAFGDVPEGESNDPLEIDYPLSYEEQPYEAGDEPEEEEELLFVGSTLTDGVSFKNMREAYRTVVHNHQKTKEEEEDTGRVLLSMRHTDMFEALVSGSPGRRATAGSLIDTYLTAFYERQAAKAGPDENPAGSVPSDFDVRRFVLQTKTKNSSNGQA